MVFLQNRALKVVLCVLALFAPFLFAYSTTILLAVLAGSYLPVMPLVVGLIIDLLYYPGHHMPMATLYGAIATVGILVVRYVIRTRIM